MMADELLNAQDLITAKKHDTFHSEVITGKTGGLSTGANIDYATNADTGQVQKTLPATVNGIDWTPVGNLTTDNCTFTKATDYAVDDSGTQWAYNGTFPFTSTAPVVPSAPDYYVVHVNAAEAITNANGGSVQDFIDAQSATIAEINSGLFTATGTTLVVVDRDGETFELKVGGAPNGYDIIDAGNGNTAEIKLRNRVNARSLGLQITDNSAITSPVLNRVTSKGTVVDCPIGYCISGQQLTNPQMVFVYDKFGRYISVADRSRRTNVVMNYAHRGGKNEAQENTMLAFTSAWNSGNYYGLEGDLQITQDGEIVLYHDDTLDTLTNGTGEVKDVTFAYLTTLKFDALVENPVFQNVKIPKLAELLDFAKVQSIPLFLEIKKYRTQADIGLIINAVVNAYMIDKVIIASSLQSDLDYVRSLNKDVRICRHKPMSLDWSELLHLCNLGNAWVSTPILNTISESYDIGLGTITYTPNTRQSQRYAMEYGADGYLTDNFKGY